MLKLLLVCAVMAASLSLSRSTQINANVARKMTCSNGLVLNGQIFDEPKGGTTTDYACCPKGYWLGQITGAGAFCTNAGRATCVGTGCFGGDYRTPVRPNVKFV